MSVHRSESGVLLQTVVGIPHNLRLFYSIHATHRRTLAQVALTQIDIVHPGVGDDIEIIAQVTRVGETAPLGAA